MEFMQRRNEHNQQYKVRSRIQGRVKWVTLEVPISLDFPTAQVHTTLAASKSVPGHGSMADRKE